MFKSICDIIKKSALASASFLAIGVILETAAQLLTLENMLPIFFAYAGVMAIFIGAVGLIGTLIAVMIPKINQQLQACQH